MQKDFSQWHGEKQKIHNENERLFYRAREVRWCSLGLNVGFESDGKGKGYTRPVLIIKGFSREVCWCVPLTTKHKKGIFYHGVHLTDGQTRNALLSHLRLIDTKRLGILIGVVSAAELQEVKRAIIHLFE